MNMEIMALRVGPIPQICNVSDHGIALNDQKRFSRQRCTLFIRFSVFTTHTLNASPQLCHFLRKSLQKRVVSASLEPVRAKWAWFMLKLRHIYQTG